MIFVLLAVSSDYSETKSAWRLTHAELGSSPPACLKLNFKVYPSVSTNREMCCFPGFFLYLFCGSRDPFWHPVQHLEQTDERRTEEFELELTRRHAGRHGAHQTAPRAKMDTSVCLDIGESWVWKTHSWVGPREAIWDIDNEMNTEEQTKETAACTQ